jgi:hypothetical protein
MSYRITRGDIEITKNVLTQLSLNTYKQLERERIKLRDEDCPSYSLYNALLDSLVFVEEQKNLTK